EGDTWAATREAEAAQDRVTGEPLALPGQALPGHADMAGGLQSMSSGPPADPVGAERGGAVDGVSGSSRRQHQQAVLPGGGRALRQQRRPARLPRLALGTRDGEQVVGSRPGGGLSLERDR